MDRPDTPIRLFRFGLSGHSHRAQLMLSLLDLPHTLVEVDLPQRTHKQPDFLALNPFGQVPVIQDGAHTVADSNAILAYLCLRYDRTGRWWPTEPLAAAEVQRWLSVAAGPLASGPAAARAQVVFGRPRDPECHRAAGRLFAVLDSHLADRSFFVGDGPTAADIALYTYTAHAPEGGVLLTPYPALQAWLQRIEALPGFVAMTARPHADPLPL